MTTATNVQNGKITQVIGPVVDVEFPAGALPDIYTALTITNPGIDDRQDNLTVEVSQHLGENTARCIAMDSTEGLVRGMAVKNTGANISMPVGKEVLGRILNVVGEPVDESGPGQRGQEAPDPPGAASARGPERQDRGLRDRHQGHRPPRPVPPRRQDRPLRRRRRRQDRAPHGAHQQRRQGPRRLLGVRRRRRAHPRGERPLPRDDRVGRPQAGRPRERASACSCTAR